MNQLTGVTVSNANLLATTRSPNKRYHRAPKSSSYNSGVSPDSATYEGTDDRIAKLPVPSRQQSRPVGQCLLWSGGASQKEKGSLVRAAFSLMRLQEHLVWQTVLLQFPLARTAGTTAF
jgi:hypothetical protein